MSCNDHRDRLLDLVYDELDGGETRRIQTHLDTCTACREEVRRLRRARSALARYRRGEPAGNVPFAPPRRRPAWRRLAWTAASLAAVALVVLGAWLIFRGTGTGSGPGPGAARAEPRPPVQLVRKDLSLTILSEPPNYRTWYPPRGHPDAARPYDLTGRWRNGYVYGWPGLALVRDRRIARNLRPRENVLRFADVPAQIRPDSVRLRSRNHPEDLSLLEQNYQYDLATASAVLDRYVDKTVTVSFSPEESVAGTLLSFDERSLVIRPAGEGPRTISRDEVVAIGFENLPEGLISTPTLMWRLSNRRVPDHDLEVAYLTRGLTWRADYVLKVRPARGGAPRDEGGRILDAADLVGYATVTNRSGVTFENARLKLMAGDVNLILPPGVRPWLVAGICRDKSDLVEFNWQQQFEEKGFFEYHLYTLGRPTTLADAETKQLELVSGSGLSLKRGYVYDAGPDQELVGVVSELTNSEQNGLGKPLPKGVVRLYAPDPEGVQTFVSEASIDHTPKDEKIRFHWGCAFDLVGQTKEIDYRRLPGADRHRRQWRIALRNHKGHAVRVTVVVNVGRATYEVTCNRPWHVREAGVVEVPISVEADGETTFDFTFAFDYVRGGGLESPYEEPSKDNE